MTNAESSIPSRYEAKLGVSYTVDTNFIGDESDAAVCLRELHDNGSIQLYRADTMDTELNAAPDDKRAPLLGESTTYVEHQGPAVWGHSRWGHSVLAGEDDGERIDKVFAILWPSADRHAKSRTSSNRLRDAMHIATAIRYGDNGFITNEINLRKRRAAIKSAFNGFDILSPAGALVIVQRLLDRHRVRAPEADRAHPDG